MKKYSTHQELFIMTQLQDTGSIPVFVCDFVCVCVYERERKKGECSVCRALLFHCILIRV